MKKRIMMRSLLCVFSALLVTGLLFTNFAFMKKAVKLNKTSTTLNVGSKVTLKVKNTKKKVTWKSSKKKVATVSKKGVVTAKATGKATITAKVGKKKLSCKVKVVKKKSPAPSNDSQATTSPKPSTTSQPTAAPTAAPTATPTTTPGNSLVDQPVEDPATRDEGWIPGWY